MQYAETILDLVGNTPLVRLTRVTRDLGPIDRQPLVLAKLEMLNPGGSVKDRIGLPMIEAAEKAGLLKPGGTIIEPTSGNTGHGLAIAAALKGYRCIFVMADKQSAEKQALLRAYGAQVVLCPTNVAPESPESYYSVAARLARDIPGAFKPDQYWNLENPIAHERTTGPEIWEQTDGRVSHFVASVGTGGTISGAGHYLREQRPDIVVVGADPEGSVLSGDTARPYLTEGVGEDFVPGTYDPKVVDRWVRVSDRDAFAAARRLTREEGILAGGSCGTALVAALAVARELTQSGDGADKVIVVLLPDGGRNYLSKLYNDEWMRVNGLLATTGAVTRVAELLAGRHHGPERPAVVVARTTERVGDAIETLQQYGISQMPVSEDATGDAVVGIVGSINERSLLDRAFRDPSIVERTVG
ncbi:MAG TPA: pyridoxal-phosphate dependent enzyme, partial [Candidatus Limnocylindrales bacterium]